MFQAVIKKQPNGSTVNMNLAVGDVISTSITVDILGVPLNLTGATIKMSIGFPITATYSSSDATPFITVPSPLAGQIIIDIPSTTTALYPEGQFNYDFWIELSSSAEYQYLYGLFNVTPNITSVP